MKGEQINLDHSQITDDLPKTAWEEMLSDFLANNQDGYFVAFVPQVKGCHTQATSLDKLTKRIKEAILLCLEVKGKLAGGE